MWLSLALFSALLFGVRRIYEKELTAVFGNFSLGFLLQVFSLVPMLALFLFFPLPENIFALSWQFWWPLLIIWFVLYPVQTYFMYRSLREGELSRVAPINALLPVFNILTSYLLIGEEPTALGSVGIIAIVVATFLLLVEPRAGESFTLNKPVLFMIIGTALPALGSTFDKISLQAATPVFYSFMNSLGATVVLLILTFVFKQQGELARAKDSFWTLCVLGLVLAAAFVAAMVSFSLENTSYVLAVRCAGFLLPVVWGIFFLREQLSARKMLAVGLFSFGILFLAL